MPELDFKHVYNQLNTAQKKAVDTLDGPVMVIAGPGTGKTQVLAARIANILLKTDTNPSSILALTFTESAAKNMRERLVSMIGKTGYYVRVHTFHSFCTEVISTHPEFFSIDRDSLPLTDLERYEVFQNLINQLPLKALKPLNTPYFYVKDIIKTISDLKREGFNPDDFQKLVDDEAAAFEVGQAEMTKAERTRTTKLIDKNREMLDIYRAYGDQLRLSQRYDFDDMISLVVQGFRNQPELLTEYQERLLYFLVDEYQDTNAAQNQVVDLLASYWEDAANIFVVGDPNQAIYRFQGASLENVVGFTQRYPAASIINLDTGYRSTPQIYTAAVTLIKENHDTNEVTGVGSASAHLAEVMSTPLTSVKTDGPELSLFVAPSQTLETVYVACKIKELIEAGTNPREIAILYRNNSDAADMTEALDKWDIRYEIDGGDNVLAVEHIRQLLCLLRVIDAIANKGTDEGVLYEVMQFEWIKLHKLLVMQVARAASQNRCSLFEMIQQGFETYDANTVVHNFKEEDFKQLQDFVALLIDWAARDSQLAFSAWFEAVINESGYLPWLMDHSDKIERLNHINSLFREVKALSLGQQGFHLRNFLEILDTLETHHLPITMEDLNITQDAVRLSTVHKAKGQEWQHVFITKCLDGKWGNSRKPELIPLPSGILRYTDLSKKERNEDERRLFYVALTRAKSHLYVSYPETIISENRSRSVIGSIFIEEIRDHLKADKSQAAKDVISQAETHLAQLLKTAPATGPTTDERAFFEALVSDFKLSVTNLNTYLRSPQDFINLCLLNVPQTKPPVLAFGTAVHESLEQWFKQYQTTNQLPTVDVLLDSFENALRHEPLGRSEFERRLSYGHEVLNRYYAETLSEIKVPLFIERLFGRGWSRTMLDDIALVGRVDRVDWVDQTQKTVQVIDYKTGQPLTAGEIEGRTASSPLSSREQALPDSIKGPYKRQLLFYKLLADLDPTFKAQVVTGCFEFVEADRQNGKLISRQFELKAEEVELLKDLIREVMSEIRTLKFLETTE